MPSATALYFCSTRNQCGNCVPMLAAVQLYEILQLDFFVCCPFPRSAIRPIDLGITMPSILTLSFSFDPEPARQLRPNPCPVHLYHQLDGFVCCPHARNSEAESSSSLHYFSSYSFVLCNRKATRQATSYATVAKTRCPFGKGCLFRS
jgi:hypothetical protein